MPFIPFANLFPDLVEKEVRTVNIFDKNMGLPLGEYVFFENYCNESGCDCHKVMVNVIGMNSQLPEILATLNFGWEGRNYYYQLFRGSEDAAEMAGSYLEPLGKQSEYASVCLEIWKAYGAADQNYISRIKRHYAMFKSKIEGT